MRRALYQLLAVLYEAPAAAGESSRAPAPPDGVLAAVARLVGRAEATGDPPPFEPITYEDDPRPFERHTATESRTCGRRRHRHAAPSGTSSRSGDWSERRSAWRPQTSAIKLRTYVDRLDEFGRSALDVAAASSPEMIRVLLGIGGALAKVRHRCEVGHASSRSSTRVACRSSPVGSARRRRRSARRSSAGQRWRRRCRGAWELTIGARNFDGPEAGNGGKWTCSTFRTRPMSKGVRTRSVRQARTR